MAIHCDLGHDLSLELSMTNIQFAILPETNGSIATKNTNIQIVHQFSSAATDIDLGRDLDLLRVMSLTSYISGIGGRSSTK